MSTQADISDFNTGVTEVLWRGAGEPKSPGEIGFDDLIAPMSRERFFAEFWEQKPLVSRGRPAQSFTSLFSIRDMDRAICYLKPKPSRIEVVTEQGFVADNYLNPDGTANLNLVQQSYLKGSTIILSGLEQNWEPLDLFSSTLEGCLNHNVAMSVYLTPPNFHGVKPHFDTQEIFVLQVEGSKSWKVYPPLRVLPAVEGSYRLVSREEVPEPLCEIVLQPGDVFYIPRGFVHEAEAGDASSLHIAVDVHVRTWFDFLSDALDAVAEREPRLRRSLPAGFLNDEANMQSLAHEFEQLMEVFHHQARLEDAVGKHAEALSVRRPPPPDGHFSMLNVAIGSETLLKKRRTTLLRVFHNNGVAGIQFSGNQIVGPAKISSALEYIAQADTITPSSLPSEALNENEKLVLARRLVRAGLLTLA